MTTRNGYFSGNASSAFAPQPTKILDDFDLIEIENPTLEQKIEAVRSAFQRINAKGGRVKSFKPFTEFRGDKPVFCVSVHYTVGVYL